MGVSALPGDRSWGGTLSSGESSKANLPLSFPLCYKQTAQPTAGKGWGVPKILLDSDPAEFCLPLCPHPTGGRKFGAVEAGMKDTLSELGF